MGETKKLGGNYFMDNASKLLELATEKFGTFSQAEEKLFKAAANGKVADYSADSEEYNDPAGAEKWGEERALKADRIAWLSTDPQASALVTHRGIWVNGVRIDEKCELPFARISFPLYFEKSAFPVGIDLHNAEICELYLGGTHTGPIRADGLKVERNIFLDNDFRAEGEVCLLGATIGGQLDCVNGRFINPDREAFTADNLKVEGSIYLRNGFKAEGQVRLVGATISGNLECDGGQFINKGKGTIALDAERLNVDGHVFLREHFKAEGEVRLLDARIGRSLDCENGQFINKNKETKALFADGVKVGGSVYLRYGFKAEGEVCLLGATIDGSLDCANGHFINPKKAALAADGVKVERSVFLCDGFEAQGEVRLLVATIGQNLECYGGQFVNKNKERRGLNADGVKVGGSVFLNDGFQVEGSVCLLGAEIGGNLGCNDGQFINPSGYALSADRLKVGGCVQLRKGFRADGGVCLTCAEIDGDLDCRKGCFIKPSGYALNAGRLEVGGAVFLCHGFKAEGEVCLHSATIRRYLDCENGQFINPEGRALNAYGLKVEGSVLLQNGFRAEGKVYLGGATIGGNFVWTGVTSPTEVTLDLRSARIGTLWDDQKSWPKKGKLFLHGLVYGEIDDDAPIDPKTRIDWLHRQPTEHFRTQPYEQLAAVLRKGGHDADAKKILIAKAKDRARLVQLTWPEKCWYHVFGKFIGYGYRPWRAFWIGLVVVVLGSVLFGVGFRADVMTPTKDAAYVSESGGDDRGLSEDYPKFNALVYSLDMFVPLVNLHQASYWLPNANREGELRISEEFMLPVRGRFLMFYVWFHIIAGWILTTLLIVGLTGLVKR